MLLKALLPFWLKAMDFFQLANRMGQVEVKYNKFVKINVVIHAFNKFNLV